ncbi:ABC transporter substrate-binding protein [Pseudomonadota bacterium]
MRRSGFAPALIITALLATVLVVTIQFSNQESAPETSLAPSKTTSSLTLRIGIAELGEFNILDPAKTTSMSAVIPVWQMYDRLVDIAPGGELLPMLATHWYSSEGLTRWHFEIRKGVKFNRADRRDVTPEDVRASIERAVQAPAFGRSMLADIVVGIQPFLNGEADHISGIQVEENEVVFTLRRPFAFLPGRIAASFFSIVPADTPAKSNAPPAGSGAYQLVEWDRSAGRVVLEKVARDWGISNSAPSKLIFHSFNSASTGALELEADTLDWLQGPSTLIDLLGDVSTVKLQTPPNTKLGVVAFNMNNPVFKGEHGRTLSQALNLALDRIALANIIGGGTPAIGPIPNGRWAKYGVAEDRKKARTLIEKLSSNYRHLTLLIYPATEERLIAEGVARQWREVGIEITFKQGQADFWDRVIGGNYQAAVGSYAPFVDKPEQYIWLYQQATQPVPNVMRFSSEAFDSAYQAYTEAENVADQDLHLAAALDALAEQPPMAWLIQPPRVTASKVELQVPYVAGLPQFYQASE